MKIIFSNNGVDWEKYSRKVEGLAIRILGPKAGKNELYVNTSILYKEKVFRWRYNNEDCFIYEAINPKDALCKCH